jgi:glycerophosphoryl diester phosphodiesterase
VTDARRLAGSRRGRGAVIGTALALVLGTGACGDATDTTPVTTTPVTTAPTTTTPTTTVPAAGIEVDVDVDVQGHRGARGLQPENTLPGFETALDLGVTTLEFDLHYTADGQVVVWHDPEIEGAKCGNAFAGRPIRELSAAELRGLTCDRNPDPGRFPDQSPGPTAIAGTDYGIVTLDELFEFVDEYAASEAKTQQQRATADRVRFNMETKRRPDAPEAIGDGFDGMNAGPFELAILETISDWGLAERSVIQSFDHRSLSAVHAIDGSLALAALTRRGEVPDFAALAAAGVTIWSPDHRSVTPEAVAAAAAAGLAVSVWTVNDPADMQRLVDLGVGGLITDRPDLALALP